ncbi:serine/threonine-protein kinase [Sorangium sp. So ce513]|uniref:serine/threonine-protein kinase n=1 Tax=Sorangium sp. So ce513 TaxID=3133315 RepID=UPI003F625EF1
MAGLEVAPGSVLAGKYRVERVLGQGGMGIVVGAWHLHLDEPVAIKVLRDELAADPVIIERFLREARAAAKIKSRHVVRVTDADRLPSGAPYIVMEWLDGGDLASIVEREGPMDPPRAARHVIEACEALGEAHALGIVHRDLKPSNLFAARQPDGSTCTKIVDFGISKLLGEELTRTEVALGTPSYMAPEQMTSARSVDARADIWALGVILYKLVTGTVPFRASTPSELGMRVLFGEPTPPEQERPDLPPGLGQVILRCLQREPARRFATAAELAAALAPFAAGQPAMPEGAMGAQGTPEAMGAPGAPPEGAPPTLAPAAAATPHMTTASGTLPRQGGPGRRASAPPQDATPSPTTAGGPPARGPGRAVVALAAVALAAAAVFALWARRAPSTSEVTGESSVTMAVAEPAAAASEPATTAEPRATLTPGASASAAPSAPATAAPPAPAAPSAAPRAPATAAPPAPAAPSAAPRAPATTAAPAPAAPSGAPRALATAAAPALAAPRAPASAATGVRRMVAPNATSLQREPTEDPFGGRRQ